MSCGAGGHGADWVAAGASVSAAKAVPAHCECGWEHGGVGGVLARLTQAYIPLGKNVCRRGASVWRASSRLTALPATRTCTPCSATFGDPTSYSNRKRVVRVAALPVVPVSPSTVAGIGGCCPPRAFFPQCARGSAFSLMQLLGAGCAGHSQRRRCIARIVAMILD